MAHTLVKYIIFPVVVKGGSSWSMQVPYKNIEM